jgi:hypothetical protein
MRVTRVDRGKVYEGMYYQRSKCLYVRYGRLQEILAIQIMIDYTLFVFNAYNSN